MWIPKEECKILNSAVKSSFENFNEQFNIQTMNFGGDRTPYFSGSPKFEHKIYVTINKDLEK